MTSIIVGSSGVAFIAVIILVAIAPKIFCRHCYEPKEDQTAATNVHEIEEEVVYGEIRFPLDTPNNQHINTNALDCECAKKTTKNTTGSEGTDHDNCAKIKQQMSREVSHTPKIPLRYDSDDNCLTTKCGLNQNIVMTVNPSYHLKRSFFGEADDLNITELIHSCEREASHIPVTLPQSNSGNNGNVMKGHSKSMPPKPSQRNDIFTKADKSKLLPTCGKGCASTPSILLPHCNNYRDKIIKKCDSEESILMTKNPPYQLEN